MSQRTMGIELVQTLLACTLFFHLFPELFNRLLLTKRYHKNSTHRHESSPVIIDTCLNTKTLHWFPTMTALALVVIESPTQFMVILPLPQESTAWFFSPCLREGVYIDIIFSFAMWCRGLNLVWGLCSEHICYLGLSFHYGPTLTLPLVRWFTGWQ